MRILLVEDNLDLGDAVKASCAWPATASNGRATA